MFKLSQVEDRLVAYLDPDTASLLSRALITYGWDLLNHGAPDSDPILKQISDVAGEIDAWIQEED